MLRTGEKVAHPARISIVTSAGASRFDDRACGAITDRDEERRA